MRRGSPLKGALATAPCGTDAGVVLQFARFAGVGIAGTSAHYATLIALVKGAGISPVPSSALGFVVGAFVNYLLNRRITFQSRKPHLEAAFKFHLVALTGLALNTSIMALATHSFNVPYFLAQAVAIGMILMWNFFANRWWTFKEKTDSTRSERPVWSKIHDH